MLTDSSTNPSPGARGMSNFLLSKALSNVLFEAYPLTMAMTRPWREKKNIR